jgi:hypothetical protein
MNPEPMTPEQVQAAVATYLRKQQQQKERQARYYQRNADKRKAYAHEYYMRRSAAKGKTESQVAPETPALGV